MHEWQDVMAWSRRKWSSHKPTFAVSRITPLSPVNFFHSIIFTDVHAIVGLEVTIVAFYRYL